MIVLQTGVYNAERFVIRWNFYDLKNPRFIIKSGFKSRAGYNGARTVYAIDFSELLDIHNTKTLVSRSYESNKWPLLTVFQYCHISYQICRNFKTYSASQNEDNAFPPNILLWILNLVFSFFHWQSVFFSPAKL